MNLIEFLRQAQSGKRKSIPIGFPKLERHIGGIQKKRIYGIASAPKVGKTTFTDYHFILYPYLQSILNNEPFNIRYIYFSFEIDRISKEIDFIVFLLHKLKGIFAFDLPTGVTKDGQPFVYISSALIKGNILDDNGNIILLPDNIKKAIYELYKEHIIKLFGEYDKHGKLLKVGYIKLYDKRLTADDMEKIIIEDTTYYGHTKSEGGIETYIHHNPDVYNIVITDHLRKIRPVKGSTIKKTVDDFIAKSVDIRNKYEYSFVHIIHTNRNIADLSRLKFFQENLFPSSDDIKDTGNLSEECDYLLTLFNPNDDRYNLQKHFGRQIRDEMTGEVLNNQYRTLHLVESRHSEFPKHFGFEINPVERSIKPL